MPHTPGPWHVAQGSDERDFIVAEPTGNTVCEPNIDCFDYEELDPSVRTIKMAEAKANARLIATAPDLFDAASTLLLACEQADELAELMAPIKQLRDVIRKAAGTGD